MPDRKPALLISYAYLGPFAEERHRYIYRNWSLDSGAFTAHSTGVAVDHQQYLDTCKRLLRTDPTLEEVFALDVIGDHDATLRNVEEAWRQGVPAIPTYHVGEPESYLLHLKRHYPKIALGGAVGYRRKAEWAELCFKRVWPHKVHGLGFSDPDCVMRLPWHSVDASSWEVGPCKFGRWRAYGGAHLRQRGSKQVLRAEVEYYLKMETQAMERWGPVLASKGLGDGPTIRLVTDGSSDTRNQLAGLMVPGPRDREQTGMVVLVACAAHKAATAMPAKDLYKSTPFALGRKAAERHADAWYILSAKHGVLEPERVIEPYQLVLPGVSGHKRNGKRTGDDVEVADAAAVEQMHRQIVELRLRHPRATFVCVGGRAYAEIARRSGAVLHAWGSKGMYERNCMLAQWAMQPRGVKPCE